MTSNTVISVEHLTKQYDLGVIGTGTISRDLNRWWARVRKQPDPYTRIGQQDAFARIGESILALDDVSFQVQQGEALGIIGRNGAGKSTLLKILSRVTAPTSGVVKVKGRIGSLLEVGTGFHPELTGRENVYLNGAILGMKKVEVTRKFDEIVDFAGVEKFIDTPVKRYSSGMYVRLAFAVAAYLESEILIVDEVLAVGDAEFQKKCLGKMGDVSSNEGRTVLFVSHNMGAIQRLCNRGLLLNQGALVVNNEIHLVVHSYLSSHTNESVLIWKRTDSSDHETCIQEIAFVNENGLSPKFVTNADNIRLRVSINNGERIKNLQLSMDLLDNFGNIIFVTSPRDSELEIDEDQASVAFLVDFYNIFLLPKDYTLRVNLYTPTGLRFDRQEINFLVENQKSFSNYIIPNRSGQIAPSFNWKRI
jgi:lipopolysaccharide transport system ATP-binding protein